MVAIQNNAYNHLQPLATKKTFGHQLYGPCCDIAFKITSSKALKCASSDFKSMDLWQATLACEVVCHCGILQAIFRGYNKFYVCIGVAQTKSHQRPPPHPKQESANHDTYSLRGLLDQAFRLFSRSLNTQDKAKFVLE